jgi:hypothetical protein
VLERYLRYAIAPEAPSIRSARLVHDGFIRTTPNGRWFPIDGTEVFKVNEPEFDWHGTIRPFPLIKIEAHDSLRNGHGRMVVRLNSIITMADTRGPEIDQSAAARWLMEGVWFPPMLGSDLVRWDDSRVTLIQPGPPVTAEATFDNEGRIIAIKSDRYRDLGSGKSVMTWWKGTCSEYRQFGSFRVPTRIKGKWLLESGDFECIDFHVQSIEYQ